MLPSTRNASSYECIKWTNEQHAFRNQNWNKLYSTNFRLHNCYIGNHGRVVPVYLYKFLTLQWLPINSSSIQSRLHNVNCTDSVESTSLDWRLSPKEAGLVVSELLPFPSTVFTVKRSFDSTVQNNQTGFFFQFHLQLREIQQLWFQLVASLVLHPDVLSAAEKTEVTAFWKMKNFGF